MTALTTGRRQRAARVLRPLATLTALAWLAACATAPPQAEGPAAPPVALAPRFAHGGQPGLATAALDADWWRDHGDATLAALVDEALRTNQDIAMAQQRVAQARAGLSAQASRLWPTVGVQAAVSRSDSGLPAAVKQGVPDTRAAVVGVDLAWEIDLAGGVRAARDAAQADAWAAAAGVNGARLLVASEVGRLYFVLRGAQEQLRIVQALVDSQHQTADRVATRQREGLASALDLDRALAEVDALRAQLPPLRTLVGVAQTQLAVLLGRSPSTPVVDVETAFAWPAAQDIPPGQPGDLLRRRPDLIAAEARVSAEGLRSDEARAQWWPKLFVNALLGQQDLRLNALDLSPVRFTNVALAFSAPLFNAGRIEAGVQAQAARTDEALLAWQKSILVAVQEVESSLLVRQQQAARAVALGQNVAHRRRSLKRAESLQREGQIDALTLLDVQRSVLASELALSDSRLQQALADVQLYKALGGGLPAATADAAPVSLAARTPK
ncbi:efflux transporter outer membrane subunit [Ideonella livida]|uniref:Efflux transporter outer membrane subunit n=1 Tax=Ideonella livida TaxID=2707176 RepID=A0A7C9PJ36_9BURK|nr:efflux transporter outer membrane subunit [Ideonella livida]NDY92454.1 efflux transporter outer membrane subunit [Ideonella livida]